MAYGRPEFPRRVTAMSDVVRSVIVGYTPAQMFALVDAVEDYPKFLPWCGSTAVSHRDERTTKATIVLRYRGLRQEFTTLNTKDPPLEIRLGLVEGPFRRLDGVWRFSPLSDRGCKVELRLQYEFSSRMLEKLVGPVFDHVSNTLVDAFAKRAGQLYG